MANAVNIKSKTKHIYYADVSDEAGNRAKVMTGSITFNSAGPSTADMNPNFTADIPNLDFVSIEAEDGYVAQYEYSTADIKILVQGTATEGSTALSVTTVSTLTGLKFHYIVWGY